MITSSKRRKLTEIQKQVLSLASDGIINRVIADRLGLSYDMVVYHKRQIHKKLPFDQIVIQRTVADLMDITETESVYEKSRR